MKYKYVQSKDFKRRILLPLLTMFIWSYCSIEAHAIFSENQANSINNIIEIRIDKNTSDEQLLKIKADLVKENFDFSYTIVRNHHDEIKNITLEVSGGDKKHGEISSRFNAVSDNDTITPIYIVIDTSLNSISIKNALTSNKAENSNKLKPGNTKHVTISAPTSEAYDFEIYEEEGNGFMFISSDSTKKPLFFIDGVKSNSETVKNLDESTIDSLNVLKGVSATQKYGEEAKYGVIEIIIKK